MSTTNGTVRKHQVRSAEVQDILGRPPSWIAKWGTTVVLFFFVILLGMAFIIPAPDIVSAGIKIRRSAAPMGTFIAEATIEQADFDKVRPGQAVDIKLEALPYEKYGILKGEVMAVDNNFSDSGGAFHVRISLPAAEAGTGAGFAYANNMIGTASIIVTRKKLIQKLSPF